MKTNFDAPEPANSDAEVLAEPCHFEVDGLGIPLLRRNKNDVTVVTSEFIYQLHEREGV